MTRSIAIAAALLCSTAAYAEAPRVVADIAPLHSLVAKVMGDVAQPKLLIEPTASPHSYALRPSQAVALEEADIVFFTSDGLTPWITTPLETLANDALVFEVMADEANVHFEYRDSGGDHDHGHGHEDDHSDDHADDHKEDHDENHSDTHDDDHKDDHADDHVDGQGDGHEGHSDEGLDPHGWLDPENAKIWLVQIAEALAKQDPENAAKYQANAQAALVELTALMVKLTAQLEPVKGNPYLVLHDAFQYFDRRFELEFAGSIALGDASAPSPARIVKAQEILEESNAACVFTEPQQSDKLVKVAIGGTDVKIGELDATGARLLPGPDLYTSLLQGLADSFAICSKG